MSLKSYTIKLFIGAALAALAWLGVLFFVDPLGSGIVGSVLFYTTSIFTLTGVFALIGLGYHALRSRGMVEERVLVISFRHAIWYALVANFALYLQAYRLLSWLNILLFIVLFAMIELLLLSRARYRS